jgi:glyoxylase-like metal-dependent hydrolase (beta-lactamase superfamily II)
VARAAGTYPADYRLAPCPVDDELRDGGRVVVGDLSLVVLDTPGHEDGHVALLLEEDGRRDLFAGDAVFHGGRIQLLATHDCHLEGVIASLRKLRGLGIDGLFPGHGAVAIGDGQEHIERANAVLDAMLIPDQLIPAAAA